MILQSGTRMANEILLQALVDLASHCNDVAQSLRETLTLVSANNQKRDTWTSVKAALRTVWHRDRIETLSHRLDEYRQQLALRVLLLLNANNLNHGDKLDTLEKQGKEIVEIMSFSCNTLQSVIEDQGRQEKHRRQNETYATERRHDELLAAIVTARDGSCRTITGPHYSRDFSSQMSLPGTTQTATIFSHSDDSSLKFETAEISQTSKKILNALHYRSIADRHKTIRAAHEKTFQWVWRDPLSHDKPWNSFQDWLIEGRGCYWISGKAGSGKSTLMKYLQNDKRTLEALRVWAGEVELLVGSFYFWYAGTSLQKSQTGLLRSLLLGIVGRRPELVPIIFPELCRSIIAGQVRGLTDLTYIELKDALMIFIKNIPANLAVCFIIDGIDEYKGDHTEICDLLFQVSQAERVKILLSSRPIPSCVQAFSDVPKLRLQDLTHNDIEKYVRDNLGIHPLMMKMDSFVKGASQQIAENLTSKAAGVFLWVVLVVGRLSSGLHDYDTLADLLAKIDELPPDLEKLYDDMLASMSQQNRRQSSKLLQIVLRSTKIQDKYPITLLQLSFAEDEEYARRIDDTIPALTEQEEDWRCEATEGRLRSRCCGLIEVQDSLFSGSLARSRSPVGFLHRTVTEFLQDETVWSQLLALTSGTKFEVDHALLSSCLSEMKAKRPNPGSREEDHQAFHALLRAVSYERRMRGLDPGFRSVYLSAIVETANLIWHNPDIFSSPQLEIQVINGTRTRGCELLDIAYPESLLLDAAMHAPSKHIRMLLEMSTEIANEGGAKDLALRQSLAACLLILYVDEGQTPLRLTISKNIAELGTEMNTPVLLPHVSKAAWNERWPHIVSNCKAWTLWEFVLHYAYAQAHMKNSPAVFRSELPESFLDVMLDMVKAGAKVNEEINIVASVYRGQGTATQKMSALAVIHEYMTAVWDSRTLTKTFLQTTPLSSAARGSKDAFAEKACRLEDILRLYGARVTTQITAARPQNKLQAPQSPRKAGRTARAILRHSTPKGAVSPDKLRTPSTRSVTPSGGNNKPRESSESQPKPSPWRDYMHQLSHKPIHETPASLSQQRSDEAQLEKRWEYTPRSQRVDLLSPEERDIVANLSDTTLSAFDSRAVMRQMGKLSYDKQGRILECVKARGPNNVTR